MDENRMNYQEEAELPLETLRARYLGKHPPSGQTPPTERQVIPDAPPTAGVPAGQSAATAKRRRSGMRILCDLLLFLSVLIVCVTTVLSFAVATTEIGGEVSYGETQNIFDFIWRADNSVYAQLVGTAERLTETDIDSDNVAAMLSAVMKLFRLIALLVPSVIILIKTAVNLPRALYHLLRGNSARLGAVAASNIAQNILVYIFFAFLGSLSGGVGEEAYFVGYTVGRGMSIGMLAGVALLFLVAVLIYLQNRSLTSQKGTAVVWLRSLSTAIGSLGIGVVLTSMRIYSIFVYVFSSSLSTAVISLQKGFDLSALIFPGLNLLLFIACLVINSRAMSGFVFSFRYLCSYGERESTRWQTATERHAAPSFVPTVVLSLLSLAAVYVLRMPAFGFGWAVDMYWHMTCIFAIAALSQSLRAVLPRAKKKKAAS